VPKSAALREFFGVNVSEMTVYAQIMVFVSVLQVDCVTSFLFTIAFALEFYWTCQMARVDVENRRSLLVGSST
jgi:hypothetical protein